MAHENTLRWVAQIAKELSLQVKNITAVAELLEEGATIPFISRYRKEATGSLDEVQILAIKTEIERLRQLEERRKSILKSIDSQGKLTEELRDKIMEAETLSKLEDLYYGKTNRKRMRVLRRRI